MKKFTCTAIILLTFSFAFANEKNSDNKKLLNTTLTSYSQSNKLNNEKALTLSYDVATFCAGTYGISKPNVNQEGGLFSYTKDANNNGYLIINLRTGMIDHYISDLGVYTITYKVGEATVSATITINKCNN